MSYRIKISYQTGDSFSTEDREDYIEGEWNDLKILEENLDRIEQHYLWYKWENDSYLKRYHPNEKKEKPSFVSDEFDFCFNLKLDDGTEYQYSAFWCGYFERLYNASIIRELPKLASKNFR